MTQSSEERIPQSSDPLPSARIIPFERPQSELQRAVQQRAQERLEAEGKKPKASKARRLITFGVALIPVTLIFSGFLVAVHAVRIITSLYATPAVQTSPTTEAASEVEAAPEVQQPGVVMLMPESASKAKAPTEPAKPAPKQ
ncbi:MAG: hypothetical protein ACJ8OJ_08840 [Povalibacter sp.]